MMNQITHTEITDSAWRGLYRVGGAAALIAVVLFRRNLGAEFSLLRRIGLISFGPATPPSSAIDWFTLLRNNRFLGLSLLNLFDIVNYALVGLIFLALYGALRRADVGSMVIATTFGFVGEDVLLDAARVHVFGLRELLLSAEQRPPGDRRRVRCDACGRALTARA